MPSANSLIGARRQVFPASRVIKQERGQPSFLDLAPERLPLFSSGSSGRESAPSSSAEDQSRLTSAATLQGNIFHFLLPDSGMADYTDKVVKQLAPAEMEQIKKWLKKFNPACPTP